MIQHDEEERHDPLSERDVRILGEAMDICAGLAYKPPLHEDTPFNKHMHLNRGRVIGLAEAASVLIQELILEASSYGDSDNASTWWEERYPPRRKRKRKTNEAQPEANPEKGGKT